MNDKISRPRQAAVTAMLPSLSIFFPCHNEVQNIGPLVQRALEVAPRVAERFEIIIVDDGSTDGTAELADELARRHHAVRAVHNERNRGYGGALKRGFSEARMDYVFFTDGDGQFDVAELEKLVQKVGQADIICGFRIRRSDPFYRTINAKLYGAFIRLLFGLKLRDLDCAFKLIPRRVLEAIELESEGALISAELMAKARRAGFSYTEVGVHHYPRRYGEQSGAKLGVILRMFWEVFKLWRKMR